MRFFNDTSPDGETDGRLVITGRWPAITVTYGDHEVKNLRALSLNIDNESLPEVTLFISPSEIEVDAECMASIEAAFKRRTT